MSSVAPPLRVAFLGAFANRSGSEMASQTQRVAELLAAEGVEVRMASSLAPPLARAADVGIAAATWARRGDAVVLDVFSGRALRLVDVATRLLVGGRARIILVLRGGALAIADDATTARLRSVLARADAIVAPSPFLARFVAELGFEAVVIPNVLPREGYPFRARTRVEPRLLWLRTFGPPYAPEMAVETLAALRSRGVDAKLTMAGRDGPERAPVERQVADAGLEDHVRFLGFLDVGGKRRELEAHDVFLNTPTIDNMPVSVLEAMAAGLPVVSTRVGGIPDLLADGESALFAPSGDATAMAAAVERLLADPELAGRISVRGRDLAEGSTWPRVAPSWRGLLRAEGERRP